MTTTPATPQRGRRLGVIAGLVVAAVVVAAVVVVLVRRDPAVREAPPAVAVSQQVLPAAPSGTDMTTQTPPDQVAAPAGISGVQAWDTSGWPDDLAAHPKALQHDHVDGPVQYAVLPPVGGPHNPVWMNAGVYTAPVPSERGVHLLEHGAVWITYRPDLPAAEVAALTALVERQSLVTRDGSAAAGPANRYVLMSPWADASLPAPVVISSWGFQLRVDRADDPRLQQFIDEYRNSRTHTPEYGVPVDGVPVSVGGRAATAGSTVANPP